LFVDTSQDNSCQMVSPGEADVPTI
jgi:hypothetical protein